MNSILNIIINTIIAAIVISIIFGLLYIFCCIYEKLHNLKERNKNIIKIFIYIILLFIVGSMLTQANLMPNWF